MRACRICLEPVRGEQDYHPRCLKRLFGTSQVPALDIELGKLHTAALAMVGHTSLSGIQKKISVSLSTDRQTLTVAAAGGLFILKPQAGSYPALPENEHVTTRLAELTGIEVAPGGLVSLKDDSLAYVTCRFDRLKDGRKVRQEDFCQLAELPPKEKYHGSAELCVRLVRQYCSEPLIELQKLYRLLVFQWWSGNGDMHLKNFSVLTGYDGITRLTPAYDLLCTNLVIDNDPLALPVGGKETRLRPKDWLDLAVYCQLPEKVAVRILENQVTVTERALSMIEKSLLPEVQQQAYRSLLLGKSESLSGSV
jgi:serine/threonine-protein kinase HipA